MPAAGFSKGEEGAGNGATGRYQPMPADASRGQPMAADAAWPETEEFPRISERRISKTLRLLDSIKWRV